MSWGAALFNFGIDILHAKLATDSIELYHVFGIVILGIPPLPITLPHVLLDSIRVLGHKQILRQRFDSLILLKLLAPIISLCRFRQDFYHDNRIKQRIILRISKL